MIKYLNGRVQDCNLLHEYVRVCVCVCVCVCVYVRERKHRSEQARSGSLLKDWLVQKLNLPRRQLFYIVDFLFFCLGLIYFFFLIFWLVSVSYPRLGYLSWSFFCICLYQCLGICCLGVDCGAQGCWTIPCERLKSWQQITLLSCSPID